MYKHLSKILATCLCLFCMISCLNKESVKKGYIGKPNVQVKDSIMSPEVLLSFGRLSNPQLSPDRTKILYQISYTSIEANKSCSNLYLCNVDGSDNSQITHEAKSISNALWSKDGRRIYYLQDAQIWSAVLMGNKAGEYRLGSRFQVTNVKNGISEFKLSPDFSRIIYVSTVPGRVKTPKDYDKKLDKAKAYVAEDLMYRHWDHWCTELPHSYVAKWDEASLAKDNSSKTIIDKSNSIDILGGDNVKYELPIEPFSGLEQLCFSPDSKKIAYSCKKLNGKQYAFSTNTDIYIYDCESGKTEQLSHGGGYDTNPIWSPDGKKIAWLSMARDGYESDKSNLKVAAYPIQKDSIHLLTDNFIYNVDNPKWSSDSKSIYFSALTQGLRALYKADLKDQDQKADISRLSSDKLWYDFNTPFAVLKDGSLLCTYCSMDFPKEIVRLTPPAKLQQISHINTALLSQLAKHKTEQRIIKTVDGKDMLCWVLYPPHFDKNKKYPLIEICLGGPQGTLSQAWSYRWNYRLMCNQGYIVLLPNRRGTTAFGPKWTEEISGDYIGLNMQDYMQAAKVLKKEPYVSKIAACGASYGGYSVYYLAGIHNHLYDCFIAHAGIFDEKYMYYETEEMWFPNWDNGGLSEYKYTPGEMGPKGDGKTFGGMQQAGSPWSKAPKAVRHYSNSPSDHVSKWTTPILCMHGGRDFRIPYDQGMAAFNCAQMMGVPSKLVIFPEENHWILKAQDALFWQKCYFDWLDKWCKDKKQ